ncbi:FkbM family methyltransferase [Rhodococcus antarcticus]|uniref:FkbM family methyltransferase n=1 Tax=Rhodococcus antarcticus TaxID=2987751 RepID=A0ABY6P181_9NOCA|nr:FkbM family methyltransferase [Rhodococcus antarcticus]UZJ24973.1 FkbM family methyltransferase [Rhodococcus antarcticus]
MTARLRATSVAKQVANRFNVELSRLDLTHAARRQAAMRSAGIDLLLDVGANRGQYVSWIRRAGYGGRIVSFEPIPSVMADMRSRLSADPSWSGMELALGAAAGTVDFHVTADTVTSSTLLPGVHLTGQIPGASVVETISVEVTRLEDVWAQVVPAGSRTMLKVDVQGAEHAVLDGLADRIIEVALVDIEMALVPLYIGGSTIYDLLPRLHEAGFDVVSIDSGFVDTSSGQVLDVDLLLRRRT